MARVFLKYLIGALAVQALLVCLLYWYDAHWYHTHVGQYGQHLAGDAVFYFYLPVTCVLGLVLPPLGEHSVMLLIAYVVPGIGALLYSVVFGILVCWARRKSVREKKRTSCPGDSSVWR